MNHTTEDSRLQVMAGMTTVFGDDGRVEVPENQTLRSDEIVETSLAGMELSLKANNEKQEEYMKKLPNFKANRDARKTKAAYQRRVREANVEQRM